MALKIIVDVSEFDFFQNKAKNAGRSQKNAGRKAKCGISRMTAGRLTPMLLYDYLCVMYINIVCFSGQHGPSACAQQGCIC